MSTTQPTGTVTVHAPEPTFGGTVAGVQFADGVAEVDRSNTAALHYFRVARYGIERPAELEDPEPVDLRELGDRGDGIVVVGSRLRDAAVDPQPGDFLAPVNAGLADPHGPLVASPGLHAVPPAPIVPGLVSPDPAVQDARESAVAEAVLVDQVDVHTAVAQAAETGEGQDGEPVEPGELEKPAQAASKDTWVLYAVNHPDLARRLSVEDAQGSTKSKLIELFGKD